MSNSHTALQMTQEKAVIAHEISCVTAATLSATQLLAQQDANIAKMKAVVAETRDKRMRQTTEIEAIIAEQRLLTSHLGERDSEICRAHGNRLERRQALALQHESVAIAMVARDGAQTRIAALKGQLLVTRAADEGADLLNAEAACLEDAVIATNARAAALEDEARRPVNVHRWRILADRDPERWSLLVRMHALQRRLLTEHDAACVAKENRTIVMSSVDTIEDTSILVNQTAACVVSGSCGVDAISMIKRKLWQAAELETEVAAAHAAAVDARDESATIALRVVALGDAFVRRVWASRHAA